jgi:hypothetical protein
VKGLTEMEAFCLAAQDYDVTAELQPVVRALAERGCMGEERCKDESGEFVHFFTTDRGRLALRCHRAAKELEI